MSQGINLNRIKHTEDLLSHNWAGQNIGRTYNVDIQRVKLFSMPNDFFMGWTNN
jgi:hypothetical protein